MPIKLTKKSVDALRASEERTLVFDSDLTGFGVRVMSTGAKQFFVQYRMQGGRRALKRRLTIGRYGSITVDEARAEARQILAAVTQGRDPAEERTRRATAATLGEAVPAFLELAHAKRKPTTAVGYTRQMERHILPALGRKRVAEVTRADISSFHLSLRDKPYMANRVLALLGSFFQWAESHDLRPPHSNPTRHVEPFPEKKRDRFLTAEEFGRIGKILTLAEQEGIPAAPSRRRKPLDPLKVKHRPKSADNPIRANPFAIAAIRFLLLSGWREGEVRTLRWEDINLERGVALLPDTKTGRSARHLGTAALAIIEELPRLAGHAYVFPGTRAGQPIINLTRLWEAVRYAANLPDIRIHDLRHAFASVAASGGLSLPIVGSLLGHKNISTTQRYAHLAADPIKLAADKASGEIAAFLNKQTIENDPAT